MKRSGDIMESNGQSSVRPGLKAVVFRRASLCARPSAADFLNRFRQEVRRKVAGWTGEYQYTIDQVLEDMIERCRGFESPSADAEDQAKLDFTILLTVHTMNIFAAVGIGWRYETTARACPHA